MARHRGGEIGYDLDTRFTGTSASALSGAPLFSFMQNDMGTASTLGATELTVYLKPKKK